MVIGTRQLGLAILMHDAAHGLLFDNRRLNEWVATWLCAAPVFTSLQLYRPYHLTHHRHTQQAEDPDLGLSAPFPITPQEPVAQDRPRPHRPHRLPAAARAVPPRPRQGVARAFIANLVLLGGLSADRLLVALSAALAAAARDLVSAGEPDPEHRRARGRARQRRPAAQYPHDAGQRLRAAVGGALLGELSTSSITSSCSCRAGACRWPIARCWRRAWAQSDGDPAGLWRGAQARDVAPGRRRTTPRAAWPAAHLTPGKRKRRSARTAFMISGPWRHFAGQAMDVHVRAEIVGRRDHGKGGRSWGRAPIRAPAGCAPQNSLSTGAFCAVRLANSVTTTSTLRALAAGDVLSARALVDRSAWYLVRKLAILGLRKARPPLAFWHCRVATLSFLLRACGRAWSRGRLRCSRWRGSRRRAATAARAP